MGEERGREGEIGRTWDIEGEDGRVRQGDRARETESESEGDGRESAYI